MNLRVEKKVLVERVASVFGWDLGGNRGWKNKRGKVSIVWLDGEGR